MLIVTIIGTNICINTDWIDIMQRTIMSELCAWRLDPDRKPLVLMGARQVGKTYILKTFAKQYYEDLVYLNFDSNKELASIFAENLEPERIIKLFSLQTGKRVVAGKTLIIFDEVQECPKALISLKYFCETAPQYHICAAGSLLGVKLLNIQGFPVGKVNLLHLYPLDFYEFLLATNNSELIEFIEQGLEEFQIPELVHNKLIELFKIYLVTGGMPEVIKSYLAAEIYDFVKVRKMQQEILTAYNLDFSKHAPKNIIMRIAQVWEAIPAQLAKDNKKFIYSVIRAGSRAKDFEEAIQWLVEASLICKVYNISKPNLPIHAYSNFDIFKLYMFDVGLYGAIANLEPSVLLRGNELFTEFKGSLVETYVAQALHNLGNANEELHYWTSAGKAELDFVIQYANQLYPIEVKSGNSNKHKSLALYAQKYSPKWLIRASPQNLKLDGNIVNIPLYMLYKLSALLQNINK